LAFGLYAKLVFELLQCNVWRSGI